MFAEEQSGATARSGARQSGSMALAQYRDVVARVEPVTEAFCRQQTANQPGFDCDVTILVDDQSPERNAFQTFALDGRPVVGLTLPFIADARNPGELALMLGHEFGHHIARHLEKQGQQQLVDALILGA